MKYWIFVVKNKNPKEDFPKLLKLKNFGFISSPQTEKKIRTLQEGDVVVFYIAGPGQGYISGEVRLTSSMHEPTRESIGYTPGKLDAMVDFDDVDEWNGEKLDLKKISVRKKLSFVTNKDNWGMSVGHGHALRNITEKEYREIKSLLKSRSKTQTEKKADEFEQKHPEGAERRSMQTIRERSPKVRDAAIGKYGRNCMICKFNFDEYYGKEFADSYIEVHHTKPFSETVGEVETDIKDVIVVCSNCHRVIHREQAAPLDWKMLKKAVESKRPK